MRVEHRVADRHVGMEQRQQLQQQRAGGESHGEPRRVAQRRAACEMEQQGGGGEAEGDAPAEPR